MSEEINIALKYIIYSFPIWAFMTLTVFGWVILQIVKSHYSKIENSADRCSPDDRMNALHEPEMVGHVLEHDQNMNRNVDRLMLVLNAPSAFLIRFHNGSVFSTNNPVWRFSITYEAPNSGVAAIADRTKDVLVSTVTSLFSPIFTNKLPVGVTEVKGDGATPVKMYHANTDSVQDVALRGFLELRTIEDLYYSPICDKDNNPIGILCVSYTFGWGGDKPNEEEILDRSVMTAAMISFDIITRNEKVNRYLAERKKNGKE